MNLSPICLFTYNRLELTQQTVQALQKNYLASESHLIIFSDGAKHSEDEIKVKSVREYLKTIQGFKKIEIIESETNKGLAQSIITGVTEVLSKYNTAIILEDDLITTPNFLDFMNQGLAFYKNDKDIYSLSGFSPLIKNNKDSFYSHTRPFPWGWATWKDKWTKNAFDKEEIWKIIKDNKNTLITFKRCCGEDSKKMLLDSLLGINNSWYIRWVFYHFYYKKLCIYPKNSFVYNIGFGIDSTNCKTINPYMFSLENFLKKEFDFQSLNQDVNKEFLKYFSKKYRLVLRIKLLKNISGIKLLIEDIKNKFPW